MSFELELARYAMLDHATRKIFNCCSFAESRVLSRSTPLITPGMTPEILEPERIIMTQPHFLPPEPTYFSFWLATLQRLMMFPDDNQWWLDALDAWIAGTTAL